MFFVREANRKFTILGGLRNDRRLISRVAFGCNFGGPFFAGLKEHHGAGSLRCGVTGFGPEF